MSAAADTLAAMTRHALLVSALFACALPAVAGCGADSKSDDSTLAEACGPDATASDGAAPDGGGLAVDALAETGDAATPNCEPPDLLVLLDRTMTMHFRPDGTETPSAENDPAGRKKTKFALAIDAIRGVLGAYDTQIRFGLSLWPRERDGCITVKERIEIAYGAPDPRPRNASCERGEIKAPPGLGNGAGTAALLDVETTPLCYSTPLGPALDGAGEYLASIKESKRAQYLMVITDGTDYDTTCPTPTYTDPIQKLHALAEAGIKTFVIGFGADPSTSGVDPVKMNKLACAAQTAKDFATACTKGASGVHEPVDATPSAPRLYYEATDKAGLDAALASVAASLGCRTCLK